MQRLFTTAALSLLTNGVMLSENINSVDSKTLAPNTLSMTNMNALDKDTLSLKY